MKGFQHFLMRCGVTYAMLVNLIYRRGLNRMMMAPRNPQHSPKHGGGHSQPAGNQHYDGHGQAHQCLLFALHRAPTFQFVLSQ